MRILTFLFLMIITGSLSFAQNAPINFEAGGNGANWTWTVFENDTNPALEILANPDQSGLNTSATVAKFTALQSGNPWAGCESLHGADIGPFVLNESNSTIKIMVWKSEISDVGIKLVAPTGWALPEIKVANTKVNEWEEITFNFSNYSNPPATEGAYDQIVIFPDFNLAGRGQTNIIYFDNITFSEGIGTTDGPNVAAPTPTYNPSDVISVFSDAYTNIPGSNLNPFWGQATVVTEILVQGNNTLKYSGLNYQGLELGSSQDVSEMEFLHLDYWTNNSTALSVFLISPGPQETGFALDVPTTGWNSVDIPLSAFAGVDLASIFQMKFEGNGDIYIDNIYFRKSGSSTSGPNAPIDFEPGGFGADWTWTVFENDTNPALEIIDNPDASGINTSSKVAKFTAIQSGNPWAGFESMHGADLGPFVLDATNSTIKIMVWKSVISDVGIKLVATTGWAMPELKVANTLVNQWEELTFDFSVYMNPPASEGPYDQIVIFPDFNLAGRGQENVIYLDNITFNPMEGTGGDEPLTAAPTPTVDPSKVISLYSDAYTDVPVDTWRTDWSSAILTDILIQGNPTKKYAQLDFVGIETVANQIDVTAMTHFHMDVWSPNFTFFGVKLVDFGADGAFDGGDDVEHQVNFNLPAQGQWLSLDIPLSDFAGLITKRNIAQLILVGQPSGSSTVFVDNVYFYNNSPVSTNDVDSEREVVKIFPNPVQNGGEVQFSKDVTKIEIYDISGRIVRTLNSASIKTDGLNQGIYIIKLQTFDNKIQTQRLIIN
ncbi:MAG: T9SS type A sorting domain-containing protein [Saprospiraceae bacterium]|nr:T9SS type A sorting domain-containing protein [Saprospiraceae bacterium]